MYICPYSCPYTLYAVPDPLSACCCSCACSTEVRTPERHASAAGVLVSAEVDYSMQRMSTDVEWRQGVLARLAAVRPQQLARSIILVLASLSSHSYLAGHGLLFLSRKWDILLLLMSSCNSDISLSAASKNCGYIAHVCPCTGG